MARSDTPQGGILNLMKTAQTAFAANPMFGRQARHFWQAQDRVLEEVEKFSSAWFKRRHEATRTAIEASAKMIDGDGSRFAQTIGRGFSNISR